jgi:hypothetical protein
MTHFEFCSTESFVTLEFVKLVRGCGGQGGNVVHSRRVCRDIVEVVGGVVAVEIHSIGRAEVSHSVVVVL